MRRLLGYADRISVRPGETICFKISGEDEGFFHLDIRRIRWGDDTPGGPGLKETPLDAVVNGHYPARFQKTQVGSFVTVSNTGHLAPESFTLQAMIWPTLPQEGEQTIMGSWDSGHRRGYALGIVDGRLTPVIGDGNRSETLRCPAGMHERHWYFVAGTFDSTKGEAALIQEPLVRYAGEVDGAHVTRPMTVRPQSGGRFIIAGHNSQGGVRGLFNGKIDTPAVTAGVLVRGQMKRLLDRSIPPELADDVVALWDFSREMNGVTAHDLSPRRLHGTIVNMPARAMTGWNHDGSEMVWTHRPEHYGAIHFHDDDLHDCAWDTDATWQVPADCQSGSFAAYLTQNDQWFYIPFYVRPQTGRPQSTLALLIATCSYYAYVNHHVPIDWGDLGEHSNDAFSVIDMTDVHLHMHPEHGLSMYDNHSDGSGVATPRVCDRSCAWGHVMTCGSTMPTPTSPTGSSRRESPSMSSPTTISTARVGLFSSLMQRS